MEDFKQITIIGMGLIGGSIAAALKEKGYKGTIVGNDVCLESLSTAKDMTVIDKAVIDIQEAVREADLIWIAVPIGRYEEIFKAIGPYIRKDAIVTDGGSVKEYVMQLAALYLPKDIEFIGGHPMAGSEKMGMKAASPYLYENAYYFLTPRPQSSLLALERVKNLIERLGAYPIIMEAKNHDQVVALISHIPHLTAVMLVHLLEQHKGTSYLPFVGGGFRDTTRIASSSPIMWRDIFLSNKKQIIDGVEGLQAILEEFKQLLLQEDQKKIIGILESAKELRDQIPSRLKDSIPPVFELVLNVQDRPGIIGEITQLMGEKSINIKEIEIIHAREGENGALKLGFQKEEEAEKAFCLLKEEGYYVSYRNNEKNQVAKKP